MARAFSPYESSFWQPWGTINRAGYGMVVLIKYDRSYANSLAD